MNSPTVKSICLLSASAVLLSACTTARPALDGQIDMTLGHAVHANILAHAVVPSDQQKNNTYIPADPARAALALKNYRENNVEQQDDIKIDP
jgi:type IV pilus biogenesis protein CpaD/CtpE